MKCTIVLSILVAAVAANAQTGSTTKAKVSAKKVVAQNSSSLKTQPVPATQTTTAATTTVAPAPKKWSVLLNAMVYTGENSTREYGAQAPISTDAAVGVGYKLTDKVKAELIGAFTYNYVQNGSGAPAARDTFVEVDPAVKLGYKSETRLLGSEPIAFSGRYYVPVTHSSADKNNGTLRFDIGAEWVMNPKWTLGTSLSTRGYLHTNHATKGANGELRLEPDLTATYNISDKFSAYVSEALYVRSTDYLRSGTEANIANMSFSYLGANYTLGALTINPFVEVGRNLNDGQAYSKDVAYYLNLIAVF